MGRAGSHAISSGHALLDAELPGGGWPCQSLTEILQASSDSAHAQWRLLSPALAQLVRQGGSVLLIGPPLLPHLPGLCREGLRADRLVRIDASTPSERLWATEQALKAGCVSAVLSWLPQARPDHIRRLHACAARHAGLSFVFRPIKAQADSSAAPLRLVLALGPCPHPLQVDIIKRRGPMLAHTLSLPHWPLGLEAVMPPALFATSAQMPALPAAVAPVGSRQSTPARSLATVDQPSMAAVPGP
jgi:protein ImuA